MPLPQRNAGISVCDLRDAIFEAVLNATRREEVIWQRQRSSFDQHPAFEANYRGVHIETSDNIKKISFSVNGVEFPHINPDALWTYIILGNAKSWDPLWEAEELGIILSVLQAS